MNVFVIGIGLLGGSLALAIQDKYPKAVIYGIDNNENHLKEAKELHIIHQTATFDDLPKATIVIVAIPVDAQLTIIPKVLNIINKETLVFDVGSTKSQICKVLEKHPKRKNFLATHPIAGTEFSGPKSAIVDLFKGKTNIICEVEKTTFKLQEKAIEIFTKIGMRIRYMNPNSHDKHIAYVSHLSHISSFMLGKTVLEKEKNEEDIFDMAGSGFASTVRLAKSSPAMWTAIFEQNQENILETLNEYIQNLQQFKQLLTEEKYNAIYSEMENTNHIKQILKGIK